jgi:hypothetical protein
MYSGHEETGDTQWPRTGQEISTEHTISEILGRWAVGAGCVLASIAIELDRERFGKLLGETETEFVRNLKCLVDFELRTWIRKKSPAEPEASASIQASI